MASTIIKFSKTIRNNWKKSVFFSAAFTYGVIYTKEYIETQDLMRIYCLKAAKFGKEPLAIHSNPRHITVILNPNANKRKATNDFEKYCAPLLYLAGISVDIKKTESEGHAKSLLEGIEDTDAIVVAGGDGTLSEVITGLLRTTHEDTNKLIPIGILPLGKQNITGKSFFPTEKKLEKVQRLADATLAVIEETVRQIDVMKIEIMNDEISKPIYAVTSLKWGAYRDAEARKDNYWYFGSLRKYVTYIFSGLKKNLTWSCNAVITYNLPCDGCSNCYRKIPKVQHTSWIQKFVKENNSDAKNLLIQNPQCSEEYEKRIFTADLALLTSNAITNALKVKESQTPKLVVEVGPENVNYIEFIRNGFKLEKGEKKVVKEVIEARTILLNPTITESSWFSIDNEDYEVKPIKVTLLPKMINVFCKQERI